MVDDRRWGRGWRGGVIGYALLASAMACDTGDAASPTGAPFVALSAGGSAAVGVPPANDVGTLTIHRLNAAEYDNTVRDLVGVATSFSATFPPDDGAAGFTDIADELTLSPLLFEHYEAAAAQLATVAVANPAIVTCDPIRSGSHACATEILARFAKRAWRRPVSADELARLVAIVDDATASGLAFADGVAIAFESALVSANFVFRIEIDPDPTSSDPHPVSDYELASRLSYFLWSSMPDDVLFAYADANRLTDPAIFDAEVHRMLADPRAQALIDGFAAQWLLRTLPDAAPDPSQFPSFDDDLRASMAAETKAFVGTFLFEDESLLDVFDAPFTFLDGRLAAHYGIPGIAGTSLVRIPLWAATHRGGLLTQASVLTMTATPTRTSPTRRGNWILGELLCAPPAPQPASDPPLPSDVTVAATRHTMDANRTRATCATCHASTDPIGFPLETYDAIGRWRDADQGVAIDATATLPSGQAIDGQVDLAGALKNDPRFAPCVTRKLFTYALGRVPASSDELRLAVLTATFAQGGYRVRDLVLDIVLGDAFRMRHGGS